MDIFSALAACCTLAVLAMLAIIARNHARYRDGRMPRQTYLRDCLSNAGIALVAAAIVLLRLDGLVTSAASNHLARKHGLFLRRCCLRCDRLRPARA